MDTTLEQVAEKCGKQLKAYQNCVSSNSRDYGRKCKAERKALAVCSEENVTVLGNIKRACQSSIDKYDNCLSENKSNPMACLDLVRELTTCVDAAARKEGIALPQPQLK